MLYRPVDGSQRSGGAAVMQGKLVDVIFWRAYGLDHRAFVRSLDDRFWFEGRIRMPGGEHEYFPHNDCDNLCVGDKRQCGDFLKSTLIDYSCPAQMIEGAISRVSAWK